MKHKILSMLPKFVWKLSLVRRLFGVSVEEQRTETRLWTHYEQQDGVRRPQ